MNNWLIDGPENPSLTLILAHGAGQGMHSPFMQTMAENLAQQGLRVIRFEFPYMQEQSRTGKRRPPDRQPRLLEAWNAVVEQVLVDSLSRGNLLIGGKSMGGRMASLLADELQVAGLVCLGYPFHPPGKPEKTRVDHLETLGTPTLICQGTRDTFGKPDEVAAYPLSSAIRVEWLEDGDHSFKPRKASGRTWEQNLEQAAAEIMRFTASLENNH